jgi:ankyrin repeat protein
VVHLTMKPISLRAVSVRALAFLVTFHLAVGIFYSLQFYEDRQAIFVGQAYFGRLWVMKAAYLLGVDVDRPGCEWHYCYPAIWIAASGGYNDEIEFLLDHGADANAITNYGGLPLMAAARSGHESTVQLLLSRGADVNAERDGDTALTLAKRREYPRIVRLLKAAGARDGPSSSTP